MFKKPLHDHQIPLGEDKDSYNRGYGGGWFDPSKDDYFSHREGRERAEREDNAWLENHQRSREAFYESTDSPRTTPAPVGGVSGAPAAGAGVLAGLVITLLFWPIVTFFVGASFFVEHGTSGQAGWLRRAGAYLFAPLYGLGIIALLMLVWLAPAITMVGSLTGTQPGESIGFEWILAYFGVFVATPGWAWLFNRAMSWLGDRRSGLLVGLWRLIVTAVCLLGVMLVAAPFA